jgi:hypothetical protein
MGVCPSALFHFMNISEIFFMFSECQLLAMPLLLSFIFLVKLVSVYLEVQPLPLICSFYIIFMIAK